MRSEQSAWRTAYCAATGANVLSAGGRKAEGTDLLRQKRSSLHNEEAVRPDLTREVSCWSYFP